MGKADRDGWGRLGEAVGVCGTTYPVFQLNQDVKAFTQLPCRARTGPNTCIPNSIVGELNDVLTPGVIPCPLVGWDAMGQDEGMVSPHEPIHWADFVN